MKFNKVSLKKSKKLDEFIKEKKLESTFNEQTLQSTLNEQTLKETFKHCSDVTFSHLQFHHEPITLIYCTGLVSTDMLYKTVPKKLENFLKDRPSQFTEEALQALQLPTLQVVTSTEEAETEIFSGKLLLIFRSEKTIYSVDISDRPQRDTEDSNIEIAVKGPRDNFIEDITINHALIRKRLRTTSLISEKFEVGKRSKTKLSILYMADIVDTATLSEIKEKILSIDVDGLYSGTQLEELINDDHPFALFPRHSYTGRPDFAVQSLLDGRFIILIDGVSFAYITPINLFFLLKTAEDSESNYLYAAFERLLRIFGIAIAAFLPGFWVALTAFHQNQIPFTLLATIVESRRGVPLPTAVEAFIMLILFEVFREAGMRLPLAVGQTLSVIGGLIIGDAAIRAGLTNPAMLVVIAASTIATFTLINQSLVGTVALIRFFVIAFVAFFGLFGFFVSVFFVGTYIAKFHSFGVPYLQVASEMSLKNTLKAFIKLPAQLDNKRPNSTNPKDKTKQGGSS
ncbi:spore germination protein [Bacillus sp. FJAT-42315]|uniref:spore germination protein n=2 Tax=Bacillus sp. FJAT-42315 TaxID=2014077 RepID=UPI000C2481F3|nr:spore germination protein [Bacillus sp. FJAT-42315]